jgi:hypothetical protein
MRNPELLAHLDLSQPVAVLFVAVLHLFTEGEDPARFVAGIRDELPPGSYAAFTHVTGDERPEAARVVADQFQALGVSTPLVPRTAAEIAALFTGFELVEPGLVYAEDWRPEETGSQASPAPSKTRWFYGGVGRRRPVATAVRALGRVDDVPVGVVQRGPRHRGDRVLHGAVEVGHRRGRSGVGGDGDRHGERRRAGRV